jgi:hypothetical protein
MNGVCDYQFLSCLPKCGWKLLFWIVTFISIILNTSKCVGILQMLCYPNLKLGNLVLKTYDVILFVLHVIVNAIDFLLSRMMF